MAQRGTNTMSEAISAAASQLTDAMQYPDADLEWLQSMIMELVNKNREVNPAIPSEQPAPPGGGGGIADLMGTGNIGGGGGAPMQMAPGMPGGMMGVPGGMGGGPSAGGGGGGGVPGLASRPAINPDDLSRIMSMPR